MTEGALDIPRILDLAAVEDRAALIEACRGLPELRSMAERHLEDYLMWFRAPEWRQVYSGGRVSSPASSGRRHRLGFSIETLLKITRTLTTLQQYQGFAKLVGGLDNPTQVGATVFEIEVAGWCATRAVHEGLVFSPKVIKATGPKYPEFAWRTSLGELFCECKEANQWERDETQRLQELSDIASDALDQETWPDDLRMDILIEGRLGANPAARLATLVSDVVATVQPGATLGPKQDGPFTATVRSRAEEPQRPPDSQITGWVIVGNKPTLVAPQNSSLTVTRSLAGTRAKLVTDLVKQAKKQLPDDGPGAVFIEMGGATTAAERLEQTLADPAHHSVVWASVWTGRLPQRAVWRTGQPFDNRLLDPAPFAPAP